jgi:hypothetical protein
MLLEQSSKLVEIKFLDAVTYPTKVTQQFKPFW